MSGIKRAITCAFQKNQINERCIATMLYFTRIYNISMRSFDRAFGHDRSASEGGRDEANIGKQVGESGHLDWRPVQFPTLPNIFFYYQTFGTVYMIYVVIRNLIFLDHLSWFIDMNKPTHCFFPGHFFLHPRVARQAATSISLMHLSWRLVQFLAQRPYFLHMFFFLTLQDKNLGIFWRQFDSLSDGTFEYRGAVSTSLARRKLDRQTIEEDGSQHPVERLLKRVVCYRVDLKDRTCYRLRPNRSPKARKNLQRIVALSALYVGSSFCVLAVGITLVIVAFNVNDRAFVARYPGCDEHLNRLIRSNQLPAWSISFTWPEIYTLLFDILENVVIWGDSGIAVMFVWTTVYLLNYDNQLHQDHLGQKLRRVEVAVRDAYLAHEDKSASYLKLEKFHLIRNKKLKLNLQTVNQMNSHEKHSDPLEDKRSHARPIWPFADVRLNPQVGLDDLVHDLQMHFADFLKELKHTDVLISEVITATICIWLTLFSVIGRYALKDYTHNRDPLVLQLVILIEGFGFLIFSIVSSGLLNLHRNCLKSYATICSLMALDRSEHKVKFLKLMELFTIKRCSAYTLLHQYPYTKTTYLSIFGWSLSCLFIFEGLKRS